MLWPSVILIFGLLLLVWSADRLVYGASQLAVSLGVSPLLIGLTIVALGTSAPEIVVSILASLRGTPALAIGNAIGSNIANVGLVLGCAAIFAPLKIDKRTLFREYPILLFGTLLVYWLLHDDYLSRADGLLLLALLFVLVTISVWHGVYQARLTRKNNNGAYPKADIPSWRAIFWVIVGAVLVTVGSEFVISGAIGLAQYFGISDLVIGLSVVAVGTSLPELITSLVGIYKKEYEISIGNVLGSNIYNLLIVLPIPGILAPGQVGSQVLTRDLPVLLASTIAIFIVAYSINNRGRITRVEGAILLIAYIVYIGFIFRFRMMA